MKRRRLVGLFLALSLGIGTLALPVLGVSQQVTVMGYKELYVHDEQLQMEARLYPLQEGIGWYWMCTLPGGTPERICETQRITLALSMDYAGAVLYPVAVLPDGTQLCGPEKTLVVELYCLGLTLYTLPAKQKYTPGEALDPTGAVIMAAMSDGSSRDVTAACSFSPECLCLGDTVVEAACSLRNGSGNLVRFSCSIPVTVAEAASGEAETGEDASDGADTGEEEISASDNPGTASDNPGTASDNPGTASDTGNGAENASGTGDAENASGGQAADPSQSSGSAGSPDIGSEDTGSAGSPDTGSPDTGSADAGSEGEGAASRGPAAEEEEGPRWSDQGSGGVTVIACLLALFAAGGILLWRLITRRETEEEKDPEVPAP